MSDSPQSAQAISNRYLRMNCRTALRRRLSRSDLLCFLWERDGKDPTSGNVCSKFLYTATSKANGNAGRWIDSLVFNADISGQRTTYIGVHQVGDGFMENIGEFIQFVHLIFSLIICS